MVRIALTPAGEKHGLPAYKTSGAAGMDLHAVIDEPLTLAPGVRTMVPNGIKISLPPHLEATIRPRSGWSAKTGVVAILGTIDSDYRGELATILANLGNEPVVIEPGMRISQLVVSPVTRVAWAQVQDLDATERGAGGFGSTGA